jgi:hypothetical protein
MIILITFVRYFYLQRFTQQGPSPQEASALIDSGTAYQQLGDFEMARRNLTHAKEMALELKSLLLVKDADRYLWTINKHLY